MNSNAKNVAVFAATSLLLGLIYAVTASQLRPDADVIVVLLRLSGRISLLIFLMIFVARPLRQLRRWPPNNGLLRNRRFLGVSFAASHSVHLGFIVWLWRSVPDTVFPLQTLIVGGAGFVLMYLMLITSFDAAARAIGPRAWRRLHQVGLYWIGTIFFFDFFVKPFSQPSLEPYWPFSVLIALAIAIRVAAWSGQRKASAG